jgi:methyl-accepting chemotaxis protein
MAEAIGLAASIIQIAGAGSKLSATLYQFVSSAARADQEIDDIAGDVQVTASALESVGEVFGNENATCVISKRAIQDANSLIKRCETVFDDIRELVDKRRKVCKDGKKSLSTLGKFAWPHKEQKVQLLRGRLESLKTSLNLLFNVLHLANAQAKGYVRMYLRCIQH